MVYISAVQRSESFECTVEDLGRERDFGFGRCERIYAPNGGFVECYREALRDLALPEEFEDLVWVREKCKGTCGSGTMHAHDFFVIRHCDGIVFLDAVNEHLANAFHRILHRQAEEGGKSWVLNVPLEDK